jgi:hypothetical protein
MSDDRGSESSPSVPGDDEQRPWLDDPAVLAWLDQHATELRRDASGPRILYTTLVGGFVIGLVAYVGGYLLRSTAPTEPLGLLADLLYTFGLALWTGVVIVVFVELYPAAKRRQIRQALDAYEASRRGTSKGKDDGAT